MRSLSGTQPTGDGRIHLGNYFGAIRQYIKLQDETDSFYFVANLHALTSMTDPEKVREQTYNIAREYLALGLDPNKATLFLQSDVPQVTELTWYLSCVTGIGLLQRSHAYKDKIAQGLVPNQGLFSYPVLMASDIIIFSANLVPVGEDQRQHIEIARDIAMKFNTQYGDVLTVPEPYILKDTAVVIGTDGRKMSKSYRNVIEIFSTPKELKKSVMGIVTDSKPVSEPKDPDTNTIFQLYRLVATGEESENMRAKFLDGGYGYGDAKKALLAKILDFFEEPRRNMEELKKNPDFVSDVLRSGAARARAVASETMERVRNAVGIPQLSS